MFGYNNNLLLQVILKVYVRLMLLQVWHRLEIQLYESAYETRFCQCQVLSRIGISAVKIRKSCRMTCVLDITLRVHVIQSHSGVIYCAYLYSCLCVHVNIIIYIYISEYYHLAVKVKRNVCHWFSYLYRKK